MLRTCVSGGGGGGGVSFVASLSTASFCFFCSFFLYDTSHPNKYGVPIADLSDDSEASIEFPENLPLSSNQLCIERVIVKVFNRYHCDVIITDRLRSLFTSKLWRMGKSLQALGGTGRAKQIKKWKDTKWTVELRRNEIISGRKRKPDNVLIGQPGNYKEKCAKLEGELKEADKKLKVVTNQMKTHEDSSKKVLSALKNVGCSSSSIVVPRKRNKIWSEYSPQYQRKKRKQIANDMQVALSFMKDENFQHSKVELKNRETGEILSVGSDGSQP